MKRLNLLVAISMFSVMQGFNVSQAMEEDKDRGVSKEIVPYHSSSSDRMKKRLENLKNRQKEFNSGFMERHKDLDETIEEHKALSGRLEDRLDAVDKALEQHSTKCVSFAFEVNKMVKNYNHQVLKMTKNSVEIHKMLLEDRKKLAAIKKQIEYKINEALEAKIEAVTEFMNEVVKSANVNTDQVHEVVKKLQELEIDLKGIQVCDDSEGKEKR